MHVRLADLNSAADAAAVVELLDGYSRDEFGSSKPLPDDVRERLVPELRRVGAFCVLAEVDGRFVGLAICLMSFSSFRARPIVNIHDVVVDATVRGQGIGQALMQAVAAEATRRGCCKVTLEVRADNVVAQRVYAKAGFKPTEPQTWFWGKEL